MQRSGRVDKIAETYSYKSEKYFVVLKKQTNQKWSAEVHEENIESLNPDFESKGHISQTKAKERAKELIEEHFEKPEPKYLSGYLLSNDNFPSSEKLFVKEYQEDKDHYEIVRLFSNGRDKIDTIDRQIAENCWSYSSEI